MGEVDALYPLTSALAHWQGIKLIAQGGAVRKREGWGEGSADVETMDRRRDDLTDE